MMKNQKIKERKFSVYVIDELHDFLEKSAEELGISKSAMMTIILEDYKNKKKGQNEK